MLVTCQTALREGLRQRDIAVLGKERNVVRGKFLNIFLRDREYRKRKDLYLLITGDRAQALVDAEITDRIRELRNAALDGRAVLDRLAFADIDADGNISISDAISVMRFAMQVR